jgi:NADPH2:quinone reductase
MRAWRTHALGEPSEVLKLEEVDDPVAADGYALIDVDATALNFPDVLLLRGQYQEKPPLPFTPGLEVAGRRVDNGAPVVALAGLPNGGLAERISVHEGSVLPAPAALSPAEAAALPITYHTGHFALHHRAHIQPGETLLVHAGAGGVGSAAIQLGRAAGAMVIATAGGPDKVKVCLDLGADVAIDYAADDFVAAVKDATGGEGADVIYDPVGGDVFDKSRKCIAYNGRLLVIGFTSGRFPDAPANHVLIKNYSVVGVHWGLSRRKEPHQLREIHADLVRLADAGEIKPLVGGTVAFDGDVPAALEALASRKTVGKIVVTRNGG